MATIERRVSENGEATYRVKVRIKGAPTESASFARLTDAKKWAAATEVSIREGRYFKSVEAKRHTFNQAVDRYKTDVLPTKPKISRVQAVQLDWWAAKLGCYTLADITPAIISACRDELLRKKTPRGTRLSPATAVRYLAVLSHLFSTAAKEWCWIDVNPVVNVRRPKEPRGRVRFLEDNEREQLLAVCKASKCSYLYIVVVLAISTGMRRGEILTLRWDQVDLARRRITLHQTKNGERRAVPLQGLAYDLVQAHSKVRRIDTSLVFPGRDPQKPLDPKKAWGNAIKVAGIADFRFHDLRHCTASYLAMNGASLAEIAEVLGHKTLQMVRRYTHLSDSHTGAVVASMNDKIFPVGVNHG